MINSSEFSVMVSSITVVLCAVLISDVVCVSQIMSHLTLIEAQHSEVESYLQKVIRSGIENSVSSTNAKNEQMNNVENGNVETRSPRKEVSSHPFMVFISQH